MEDLFLDDIPYYKSWRTIEKVNYGWSDDKKFYIEDIKGSKFLLCINNIEKLENKKKEFYISLYLHKVTVKRTYAGKGFTQELIKVMDTIPVL